MKFSILLPIFFCLFSCTEIIDISTIAPEPQLVVEATIVLGMPAEVILTKSIALDKPNSFEKVSNARVQVSDSEGNSEELILNKDFPYGYISENIKGEKGKTYTIRIEHEGKIITSTCKMPTFQVPIDTFTVQNTLFPGGPPAPVNQPTQFYEILLKFSDPIQYENYYRFNLYYNRAALNRNSIASDRFTNGKQMEQRLLIFSDSLKVGDKIQVEMLCIDKEVFQYFESMGNSTMGPGNSSSPANPYTNLNGAILGYFSAHTLERREWVKK